MYNDIAVRHQTVVEYLVRKSNLKKYEISSNKTKISKKIDYSLLNEVKKFASKIASTESIKSYGYYKNQVLEEILAKRKLPLENKVLHGKFEDGKLVFYYTNEQILNFVKILKKAYLNKKIFEEFIKIPDVYYMLVNLYKNNIFFHKFIDVDGLSLKYNDVLEILDFLGLSCSEYINEFYLLSGCSLMVYGLRGEVGDIDLVVSTKVFDMLNKKFKLEYIRKDKYRIGNLIEFIVEDKENFKCKKYNNILVEDLQVVLNRKKIRINNSNDKRKVKKDLVDIDNIENYLKVHR